MSNPNDVSCSTCPYWWKLEIKSGKGQCRLKAPVMVVITQDVPVSMVRKSGDKVVLDHSMQKTQQVTQVTPVLPHTTEDFWCGEHPAFRLTS